jgi:hypothetical protein
MGHDVNDDTRDGDNEVGTGYTVVGGSGANVATVVVDAGGSAGSVVAGSVGPVMSAHGTPRVYHPRSTLAFPKLIDLVARTATNSINFGNVGVRSRARR